MGDPIAENLREAIYTAKIRAYATSCSNPEKEAQLKRLRALMDEAHELCDEILDH